MFDPLDNLTRDIGNTVRKLNADAHKMSFDIDSNRLDPKLKKAKNSDRLMISFHGAFDWNKRSAPFFRKRRPPVFNGFFDDLKGVHQLCIADPSSHLKDPCPISWFAGHQGRDSQAIIRNALSAVIDAFGVTRPVLFGASGGSFAALFSRMGSLRA